MDRFAERAEAEDPGVGKVLIPDILTNRELEAQGSLG